MKAIRRKGPFHSIPFTRSGNKNPGDVVIVSGIVGVDTHGGLDTTDGELDIAGTFEIEKVDSQAFAVGATAYWNATADPKTPGVAETGAVTATVEDAVIGVVEEAAGSSDTKVIVGLQQTVVPSS